MSNDERIDQALRRGKHIRMVLPIAAIAVAVVTFAAFMDAREQAEERERLQGEVDFLLAENTQLELMQGVALKIIGDLQGEETASGTVEIGDEVELRLTVEPGPDVEPNTPGIHDLHELMALSWVQRGGMEGKEIEGVGKNPALFSFERFAMGAKSALGDGCPDVESLWHTYDNDAELQRRFWRKELAYASLVLCDSPKQKLEEMGIEPMTDFDAMALAYLKTRYKGYLRMMTEEIYSDLDTNG